MFKKNQKIFNILFEAVSEGIILVDKDQKIVAVNSSSESIFGYQKDELINQSLDRLIPMKYRINHKTHFNVFMNSNSSRKIGQVRGLTGLTKNNKEFPIEIGLNAFTFYGNKYILALVIDISERKEAEKEIEILNTQLEKKIKERTSKLNETIIKLKELNTSFKEEIKKRTEAENKLKITLQKEIELNDLKTKFLSLVSHEFKTPLSGILTSAILLEKYKLSEEQDKRDKHLKTITNKIHYLNNILNDFLSIERLDSGKINYKFTTFNLSKVINEVIYNSNMLLKSGQRINIPNNIDEFKLHQDEKILELSLSNLIHNAIKYSPENTDINFEIERKKKNIVFKVSDQGIGIPEKDQKHLFNRYFRAQNVLTYPGTGIGLNIAKVHLENLGGNITFKSKENQGSVFIVELPIIKE